MRSIAFMHSLMSYLPRVFMAIVVLAAAEASAGSSLCTPEERTVWECPGTKKAYALCASADMGANTGYLQYRVGTAGRVEFTVPLTKRHPNGRFFYTNYSRFARLTFENAAHTYEIEEQLVGPTSVRVTRAGKAVSEFQCSKASRTLMDTDVINLFNEAGVSTR